MADAPLNGPSSDDAPSNRASARHGERWHNRLLAAVLALLVLYAAALAKSLLVPVLLAMLLSLLLAPAVRRLCRWYVPRAIASVLVLGLTLALIGTGVSMLSGPAQSFLDKVPQGVQRIERTVKEWRRPMAEASRRASQSLDRLANLAGSAGPSPAPPAASDNGPGLIARTAAQLPSLLAGLAIIVFLTFMLLLHGDTISRKTAALMPRFQDRRRLVQTTRATQNQLSTYVLTITGTNIALGLVVAGVLALLGLDDPLLWGGVAALLNFAPYVGPLIGLVLLALAGFAQFADPVQALMPALAFFVIQMIEGEVITPLILGRNMALDPVIVLLSLLLLGWLWGVAGLLMAVPLLTCLRICAEQVRGWSPLARLLGPATALAPQRQRQRLAATRSRPHRSRSVARPPALADAPPPVATGP